MSFFTIVINDLHLAGGYAILNGFGDRKQSPFQALPSTIAATGNHQGPAYGNAQDGEPIINGDCFDLLVVSPIRRMECLIRVQLRKSWKR